MRALLAALAALALGCLNAPAAFAQTPDFTWDPDPLEACEQATFTPVDVSDPSAVTWQYGAGTNFVSSNTFTFDAQGSYDVTMDDGNGTLVTKAVPVGNAPPVAFFDYNPEIPWPGDWVVFDGDTFSHDCEGSIQSFEWEFDDGDPDPDSTDPTPIHQFIEPRVYHVTLTVTDQDGATDSVTHMLDLSTPTAAFDRLPDYSVVLTTGESATFTSQSTAAPGSTLDWEVDGAPAGSGDSIAHTFATPGTHVVRLTVGQPNLQGDVAESTFRVNAPPTPGFVWTPGSPVAGNEVQLYSTSVDAEGALADQDQVWDLDDDGQFDDATGPVVTQTFTAGDHAISLRVTDSDNVSRTITRTITVAAPVVIPAGPAPVTPTTPTTPSTPAAPPLMKPFPTVRLVGVLAPGGARITVVEVRGGPRGAKATVRCIGEECPFRSRRRVLDSARVRFSKIGLLKAGTRLQVLVRAPGVIGKYVGFRIRDGKRPLRADRCLMPGASEPTRCT